MDFASLSESKKVFAWTYVRDEVLCVNVKVEPGRREFWRATYAAVRPSYHQNKEHWNTLLLDGSIPRTDIERMIAESYDLIAGKKGKGSKKK